MKYMAQSFITALDEHFCAHYSDYVRISALEGYKMPDMITIASDGNIVRRDSLRMRLCYQENCAELLARFKQGLADTDFTFNFLFPSFADRIRDRFRKYTFAKYLPAVLSHADETAESAGKKLAIEPRFWNKIIKGKLYPEKNAVLAIALVCRLSPSDANNLLGVCGYTLAEDNVRDVVVGYLLERGIFNEQMRDACLAEYKITNLPIAREEQNA